MKCRFAVCTLMVWIGSIHGAEIEIIAHNPRPFGYVVGDIVARDLSITVKSGYSLDENNLPKPGRLSAWLELRSVDLTETRAALGRQYALKLTYQLPNSPTEVKIVDLPAHKFTVTGPGKPIDAVSSEWPITLAPITPEQVLARDGLEALRPDIRPTGLDTKSLRWRLMGYAAALTTLLLYWAYRFFGIPYLAKTRRPFTLAYRDLKRLVGQPEDYAFAEAVERIHKALNETAGRALFMENLDHFLANRGVDEHLATLTREFFTLSRGEFFASGTNSANRSVSWLMEFCGAWRSVERGMA